MAVLLKEPVELLPISGVRLATGNAGLYKNNRDDLALIELAPGSTCAAVFTKNAFCAAPVQVARGHLQKTSPGYCLINSGNANAGTGHRGYEDALACCRFLAAEAGCQAEQVLPFSTGVIGEYLPVHNIRKSFTTLLAGMREAGWLACARAIMTTDTVAKGISRTLNLGNKTVQITGIAKGSGMIRPDMATMLAFIATDAGIDASVLEAILNKAVECSFNRICVDGDTSTNDACLLIATGKSEISIMDINNPLTGKLQEVILDVCKELAQAIIRDGEGATKFISIIVERGTSKKQCLDIAYAIATSSLVKTAMYAADPNWGRIIAAAGRYREEQIHPEKISVFLNELCIVNRGEQAESYTEAAGAGEMSKPEIVLRLDLGLGQSRETLWTCDLSPEYIRINAEYRS